MTEGGGGRNGATNRPGKKALHGDDDACTCTCTCTEHRYLGLPRIRHPCLPRWPQPRVLAQGSIKAGGTKPVGATNSSPKSDPLLFALQGSQH